MCLANYYLSLYIAISNIALSSFKSCLGNHSVYLESLQGDYTYLKYKYQIRRFISLNLKSTMTIAIIILSLTMLLAVAISVNAEDSEIQNIGPLPGISLGKRTGNLIVIELLRKFMPLLNSKNLISFILHFIFDLQKLEAQDVNLMNGNLSKQIVTSFRLSSKDGRMLSPIVVRGALI